MKTKHTPGPWRASKDCWPWEIDDSTGASIAIIEEMFRMGDSDENEANARLIAAAPDLLEACIEALNRTPDTSRVIGPMLRAAIAKATGDTP